MEFDHKGKKFVKFNELPLLKRIAIVNFISAKSWFNNDWSYSAAIFIPFMILSALVFRSFDRLEQYKDGALYFTLFFVLIFVFFSFIVKLSLSAEMKEQLRKVILAREYPEIKKAIVLYLSVYFAVSAVLIAIAFYFLEYKHVLG